MGFRFTKRIKVLPGLTLNLSKSGLSTTIGPKGAKVTLGKRGARLTTGIPGTGVSYSTTLTGQRQAQVVEPTRPPRKGRSATFWLVCILVALVFSGWLAYVARTA